MATVQEHRSKALHNEKLIDVHKLADGEFIDWAIIVLFYSALHWMRALAAQEGCQIKTYRTEETVFQRVPTFAQHSKTYLWYRQLKDSSRDGRYEMTQFSTSDFNDLDENCFKPFVSFVNSKLRP